jgi:serine/threonine protein kinase
MPEKVGRYEVKTELSRSGMVTVYQAYDPSFEREVVIKVLPSEMLHDPQFRVRVEREAKNHRNVRTPGHRAGLRFWGGKRPAQLLNTGAIYASLSLPAGFFENPP